MSRLYRKVYVSLSPPRPPPRTRAEPTGRGRAGRARASHRHVARSRGEEERTGHPSRVPRRRRQRQRTTVWVGPGESKPRGEKDASYALPTVLCVEAAGWHPRDSRVRCRFSCLCWFSPLPCALSAASCHSRSKQNVQTLTTVAQNTEVYMHEQRETVFPRTQL